MAYKLKGESDIKDDIERVIDHINKSGYVIKGDSVITRSSGASKNIYDQVFTALIDEFDNSMKKIKAEFTKLFNSKAITVDVNNADGQCEIEEPIPCNLANELIDQFNEIKRIFVDPTTFAYYKILLSGGKSPISTDQYRTELTAYVHDYNRRCKLWWRYDNEGKKQYPYRDFIFKGVAELTPRVEAKNFEFEVAARKQIRAKLAYNGKSTEDAIAEIKKYVVAMRVPEEVDKFKPLGLKNSYQDIVSYVLLHWMWLVKRNLHDSPKTNEELFVNIYGSQGSGKTTFVECLSRSLEYFYAEADVAKVMDPREAKIFVNKRIVFFDEFGSKARLSHDEVSAMKKLITSDRIDQRIMHTTSHSSERRKFTGISATNATIGDIVKDESGARRYAEIITDTDYSADVHFDFDFMDKHKVDVGDGKFAFVDIWKYVDDTIEEGYISLDKSIREDLRAIQDTYVPKSSTLQFLDSEQYTYINSHKFSTPKELKAYIKSTADSDDPLSEDDYIKVGIADLYKRYTEWCKVNNLEHNKARSTFKRDLDELPILTCQQKSGRDDNGNRKMQTFWFLFVNNDYE